MISIVIPVYNVERYLRRCVDSVIAQTYANIEIILVDDGSTDASGDICEEYAGKDVRIKVIHQENGGLSSARNTGIEEAKGEYLTFIDSDDFVDRRYAGRLYELIQEYGADISIAGFVKFKKFSGIKTKAIKNPSVREYDGISAISDMWYQKTIPNFAWAKMYKRKLFEGIRYPVGKLYEDLGTTYRLFYKARRIVYSAEPLYFYFQRSDSIMNEKFRMEKMDRILVSRELLDWSRSCCPALTDAAGARFFISNVQVLAEIPNDMHYKDETAYIKSNIKKYRKSVVRNRDAKPMNRLIAAVSVLDIRILKRLGFAYKKLIRCGAG